MINCSFWLVTALAQAGEVERAEHLFDSLVSHANDLGLIAEEIAFPEADGAG